MVLYMCVCVCVGGGGGASKSEIRKEQIINLSSVQGSRKGLIFDASNSIFSQ